MAVIDHQKDPDARLDWIFDWNDWLGEGETISTSEFFASVGIVIDATDETTKTATAWLTGGTAGQVYELTNRITSTDGRIDDRTITIRCTER